MGGVGGRGLVLVQYKILYIFITTYYLLKQTFIKEQGFVLIKNKKYTFSVKAMVYKLLF